MTKEYDPTIEVQEKLQLLQKRFKNRLRETLDTISDLHATSDQRVLHETIDQLIHISHKLAGSAGTFGFSKLSQDMKKYETQLRALKSAPDTDLETKMEMFYQDAMEIITKAIEN